MRRGIDAETPYAVKKMTHNEKLLMEKAQLAASSALKTGPEAVDELVHLLHEFSLRWRANLVAARDYKGDGS